MALKLPQATNHSNSHHGRRLMQMLFRANASNNDEHADQDSSVASQRAHVSNSSDTSDKHNAVDPRAEEDGDRQQQSDGSRTPRLNGVGSHRASLPTAAQSSSKFHSLKRKLFPSRMRTALPARIPPLITSPISVSKSGTADAGPDALPREDDDDDLELELAIENRDTGTEQDTLDEMNLAIESLLKWRQHQEQETQDAIRKINQASNDSAGQQVSIASIEEDSQALEEEYKRKMEQWELERETQMTNLKHMEERFQVQWIDMSKC
ncbi:hypothetical protein Gpo141_00008730 [Globisporangium polare]